MGKFLQSEKPNQVEFKRSSCTISSFSEEDGIYKNYPYPFCLPRDHAEENLFPPIRNSIREYFYGNEIKWHDGQNGNPSNHMCDSQVCCANFLFPFANQPKALAALLRPIFPELQEILPVEDGLYVAFEWIGEKPYLNEVCKSGKRSRGANFTSADAIVRFQRMDGLQQISLIEWKYTESYSIVDLSLGKSGQTRKKIYAKLFNAVDAPINKAKVPCYEALFFEPFYQFMRQQLLAHEMEKAHELGADIVSLLHIVPAHNQDFRRITSPYLVDCGESATDVWGKLVSLPDRFISVSTESLFGSFTAFRYPEMALWKDYIFAQYPWVAEILEGKTQKYSSLDNH